MFQNIPWKKVFIGMAVAAVAILIVYYIYHWFTGKTTRENYENIRIVIESECPQGYYFSNTNKTCLPARPPFVPNSDGSGQTKCNTTGPVITIVKEVQDPLSSNSQDKVGESCIIPPDGETANIIDAIASDGKNTLTYVLQEETKAANDIFGATGSTLVRGMGKGYDQRTTSNPQFIGGVFLPLVLRNNFSTPTSTFTKVLEDNLNGNYGTKGSKQYIVPIAAIYWRTGDQTQSTAIAGTTYTNNLTSANFQNHLIYLNYLLTSNITPVKKLASMVTHGTPFDTPATFYSLPTSTIKVRITPTTGNPVDYTASQLLGTGTNAPITGTISHLVFDQEFTCGTPYLTSGSTSTQTGKSFTNCYDLANRTGSYILRNISYQYPSNQLMGISSTNLTAAEFNSTCTFRSEVDTMCTIGATDCRVDPNYTLTTTQVYKSGGTNNTNTEYEWIDTYTFNILELSSSGLGPDGKLRDPARPCTDLTQYKYPNPYTNPFSPQTGQSGAQIIRSVVNSNSTPEDANNSIIINDKMRQAILTKRCRVTYQPQAVAGKTDGQFPYFYPTNITRAPGTGIYALIKNPLSANPANCDNSQRILEVLTLRISNNQLPNESYNTASRKRVTTIDAIRNVNEPLNLTNKSGNDYTQLLEVLKAALQSVSQPLNINDTAKIDLYLQGLQGAIGSTDARTQNVASREEITRLATPIIPGISLTSLVGTGSNQTSRSQATLRDIDETYGGTIRLTTSFSSTNATGGAAALGNIYTISANGAWSPNTQTSPIDLQRNWMSTAIQRAPNYLTTTSTTTTNAAGTIRLAVVFNGPIFLSYNSTTPNWNTIRGTFRVDATNTLTQANAPIPSVPLAPNFVANFVACAMSADGVIQYAVCNPGFVYRSTNSGVNWERVESAVINGNAVPESTQTPAPTSTASPSGKTWTGVALNFDGTRVTLIGRNDKIYTGTFTYTTPAAPNNVVSVDGVNVPVRAIASETWSIPSNVASSTINSNNANAFPRDWISVSMSPTGKYQLAAIDDGYLCLSSDFGQTWSFTTPLINSKENNGYGYSWRSVDICPYVGSNFSNGNIPANFMSATYTEEGRIMFALQKNGTNVSNNQTDNIGLWYSIDYGVNWNYYPSNINNRRPWGGVASDMRVNVDLTDTNGSVSNIPLGTGAPPIVGTLVAVSSVVV